MAKAQDRHRNVGVISDHGAALFESGKRLALHTATYPVNTEAGRIMDRRIILEELNIIMKRAGALYSALAEGE